MRPTSTQEHKQPKTQRTYAEVCRMDKERTLDRNRNVRSREEVKERPFAKAQRRDQARPYPN
ncbi:hypothetical protein DPMN_092909 [Dreissena polymorpha]|uniref:Uncharacterized protein n=1 Tax=Dreissena polymorpha TaxID=45954 RepID=A0A9D4L4K1_DREPO|nr:hypothetical protein DPMN_092909 [Dreissena polymorpha]